MIGPFAFCFPIRPEKGINCRKGKLFFIFELMIITVKMKKLIFIFLFLPICLFAQSYSETVDMPGKDASALYNKALKWFKESFPDGDAESLKEDQANGILTGREKFAYLIYSNNVAVNMTATYILRISVKDGQYKYEFDNVMIEHGKKFPLSSFKNGMTREGTIEMYKASGMPAPSKKMIETNIEYSTKVVNQFETEINRIIESLKEKMEQ